MHSSSASHDIDLFRWLSGEEVDEVCAVAKTSQDKSTVTVALTLTSQSGVLGVMELCRGPEMTYDIGCEIIGSRGSLTLASLALTMIGRKLPRRLPRPERRVARSSGHPVEHRTIGLRLDGYANNAVIDAALAALASGRAQRVRQETESTVGVTP